MRTRSQNRKANKFSIIEGSQISIETLVRKSKSLTDLSHILTPTTLNSIPPFN